MRSRGNGFFTQYYKLLDDTNTNIEISNLGMNADHLEP